MRIFEVIAPLHHDGKLYPIGSRIPLSEIDADILLLDKAIAAPEVAANVFTMTLTGSDYLPALIRLTPELTVKQTEIVELAAGESGLDNAAWNALPDDEREGRIGLALEQYRYRYAPSVLSETGLGTILAAAEGAKVATDNAVLDAADAAALGTVSQGDTASAGSETVDTPTADDGASETTPPEGDAASDAEATDTPAGRRRKPAE